MVKFIIKSIVLVALIIFTLISFTDSVFENKHFYKESINNYHDLDGLNIAIFGSSHAHSSYDSRILELWGNGNVYNLGGPAQRLTTSEIVANMVVSDHEIDLAIIDVFSVSFNEPDNERYRGLQLNSLDYLPTSRLKVKKLYEIFGSDKIISGISPTIRNHSNWNKAIGFSSKLPMEMERIDVYKGFRTTYYTFGDSIWKDFQKKFEARNRPYKKDELTPKEKTRINDIIAVFKQKNIPVLFVNAPSYVTDVEEKYRKDSKIIRSYIEELGYPFIDYNTLRDSLGLKRAHFKDPNHLNVNGALLVSAHLKNFLETNFSSVKNSKAKVFKNNRYYHIETNFRDALFNQSLDSAKTSGTYGMKSVHIYKVNPTRYELIIPLVYDSIVKQPVRIEYDISLDEYDTYEQKRTVLNSNNDRAVLYGTIDHRSVIHYKNKAYAIFPFNSPLKTLRNVRFHAGDNRRVLVFDIPELISE